MRFPLLVLNLPWKKKGRNNIENISVYFSFLPLSEGPDISFHLSILHHVGVLSVPAPVRAAVARKARFLLGFGKYYFGIHNSAGLSPGSFVLPDSR